MTNKGWKYAGIVYDSIVDGDGIGATFFTQYCPHHCKGCHNPNTWDKDGGLEFTDEVLNDLLQYFESELADHLTMSGGDPMASPELTLYVISKFKEKFKDKKVWLYTGYTYEYLIQYEKYVEILKMVDFLVDGLFIESKKSLNCLFRGSTNQRIINVKESLNNNKIILWEERK